MSRWGELIRHEATGPCLCGCEDADHQHCWHWDTDADCERCCVCDTVMED